MWDVGGGATGLMGCQGRGQTQEMAWDTVALKPAPRSWEPLADFEGGVAWSACALGSLYWKHCKGLTHDKCSLVTRNRKGSWTGGHVSHRDPGAVNGVGDADLQLLRSPAHLPCIGQGLAGELLADPGGRGSPGLELEIRGETAQGEQLYRKEIYLLIRQTLPTPLG